MFTDLGSFYKQVPTKLEPPITTYSLHSITQAINNPKHDTPELNSYKVIRYMPAFW